MTNVKAPGATRDEREFLEKHADELSPSTLRARWVHDPSDIAGRDGETLATRSQDVIRAWAEARNAFPVTVEGTEHGGHAGVLRMRFRDEDPDLEQISWDDWFDTFSSRNLVFLFQDTTSDGRQSNFFRLDSPDREDA